MSRDQSSVVVLPINEVRLGMYLVKDVYDAKGGHLVHGERLISSPQLLAAIQRASYQQVVVDLARSHLPDPDELADQPPPSHSPFNDELEEVPFEREFEVATEIQRNAITFAREMAASVQAGYEPDLDKARNVVDGIVQSTQRNKNVLLNLIRLRKADEYTFSHGVDVSVLAACIACALDMAPDEVREVALAGLLHDLGKSMVPLSVLKHPGKLSQGQWDAIKKHPDLSRVLLNGAEHLPDAVVAAAHQHHEKVDGTGYPLGAQRDEIHPYALILAVADVYDALTSERPYKGAMPPSRALSVMYRSRGTHFDAEVLERLIWALGVYPMGSLVRLSTGELGLVSANNPHDPVAPKVLLLYDATRVRLLKPYPYLDLSTNADDAPRVIVTGVGDPATLGIDVDECLPPSS